MKKLIFKIAAGALLVGGLALNVLLNTNDINSDFSLQNISKSAIAQAEGPWSCSSQGCYYSPYMYCICHSVWVHYQEFGQ